VSQNQSSYLQEIVKKWNINLCPPLCVFEDGCPLLCGNWTSHQLTILYCFFTTLTSSQGQTPPGTEAITSKVI